jgi:hypothetical protein
MDRDPPSAKVVHTKHAADDISSHAVEHQDLPDGIAILVQDWGGMRDEAVGGGRVLLGVA